MTWNKRVRKAKFFVVRIGSASMLIQTKCLPATQREERLDRRKEAVSIARGGAGNLMQKQRKTLFSLLFVLVSMHHGILYSDTL
jgi:hypothetical protein